MSCFVVDNKQLDVIVSRMADYNCLYCNDPIKTKRLLYRENVKAYNIRYPDDKIKVNVMTDYKYHDITEYSDLQVIQFIYCLMYQYAEYNRYEQSRAYKVLISALGCITRPTIQRVIDTTEGLDWAI